MAESTDWQQELREKGEALLQCLSDLYTVGNPYLLLKPDEVWQSAADRLPALHWAFVQVCQPHIDEIRSVTTGTFSYQCFCEPTAHEVLCKESEAMLLVVDFYKRLGLESLKNQLSTCRVELADWNALKAALEREKLALESEKGGGGSQNQQRSTSKAKVRPKRSTRNGEALDKLVSGLTTHHAYSNGHCENEAPIGNNKLAELTKVVNSTASKFFKDKFGGHSKYKALCHRDPEGLAAALKLLNKEFSPLLLYGRTPPGEGRPDDDDDE